MSVIGAFVQKEFFKIEGCLAMIGIDFEEFILRDLNTPKFWYNEVLHFQGFYIQKVLADWSLSTQTYNYLRLKLSVRMNLVFL